MRGDVFFFDVSLLLGLAHISSERQYSERVVSHGNAHEYPVVYGRGFVVNRRLGESSTFDRGDHVEADDYQVAVCLLFPRWTSRWGQRALLE